MGLFYSLFPSVSVTAHSLRVARQVDDISRADGEFPQLRNMDSIYSSPTLSKRIVHSPQLQFAGVIASQIYIMSNGTLHILDSRTSTSYDIPIYRNSIRALDLQRVRAPLPTHPSDQASRGLRVFDPGLQNTAVMESAISFSWALIALSQTSIQIH